MTLTFDTSDVTGKFPLKVIENGNKSTVVLTTSTDMFLTSEHLREVTESIRGMYTKKIVIEGKFHLDPLTSLQLDNFEGEIIDMSRCVKMTGTLQAKIFGSKIKSFVFPPHVTSLLNFSVQMDTPLQIPHSISVIDGDDVFQDANIDDDVSHMLYLTNTVYPIVGKSGIEFVTNHPKSFNGKRPTTIIEKNRFQQYVADEQKNHELTYNGKRSRREGDTFKLEKSKKQRLVDEKSTKTTKKIRRPDDNGSAQTKRMCKWNNLTIHKVLSVKEKGSASTTIMCEGTYISQSKKRWDVFVKLSFAVKPEKFKEDNSLEIESLIYSKVLLDMQSHTPNVILFVEWDDCFDMVTFQKSMDEENKQVLTKQMNKIAKSKEYIMSKPKLVVTKKTEGGTLAAWLMKLNRTKYFNSFLNDILFQIAYTLVVFEDFGLMHNDLHTGNVFVEKLSEPVQFVFRIGDNYHRTRTVKYHVKIYDFDRSSKQPTNVSKGTLNNNLLDSTYCDLIGTCNEFIPRKDWFTILKIIFLTTQPSNVSSVIPKIVPSKFLQRRDKETQEASGHPCYFKLPRRDSEKCILEMPKIMSPLEFLKKTKKFKGQTSRRLMEFVRPTKLN
jgi:hypothetical protein